MSKTRTFGQRFPGLRGAGALLVAASLLGGCGVGSATFSGDIGERSFTPVGTVFGYVDALEAPPELKGRDESRVVAAMTYAAFDPGVDQEYRGGAELADLVHAIEIHDWVSLRWDDRQEVTAGSKFTDVLLAGSRDGRYDDADSTAEGRSEGFSARFGLAREPLEPGASYADYLPFGTRAIVTAQLDEVDLDQGGVLRGSLSIQVERIDGDPADARSGTVEGEFSAQIVGERIAEKNFETLRLYELLAVRR